LLALVLLFISAIILGMFFFLIVGFY